MSTYEIYIYTCEDLNILFVFDISNSDFLSINIRNDQHISHVTNTGAVSLHPMFVFILVDPDNVELMWTFGCAQALLWQSVLDIFTTQESTEK